MAAWMQWKLDHTRNVAAILTDQNDKSIKENDACETLLATLPAVIDVKEDLMDVSSERGATA